MSSSYSPVSQYFLIGKTLKSHGTSGEIRLMIEDRYKYYLQKDSYIFFDLNGSKVPYKIIDTEDANHFVISLEGVINKKDSDVLSGLDVWVPLDVVKAVHQRSPKNIPGKWHEYHIRDEHTNSVYEIRRVEEFPQQMMAVIQIGEKEILVPLSDQLITSIDQEKKIILMQIPEGLLDL